MMLERAAAAALGTATVAAASGRTPDVWHFLGYPYEAASMIAALFAATVTRVLIEARGKHSSPTIRVGVWTLSIVTTAVIVAGWQTNLVEGLLYGTGIAAIGEGLIRIAVKYTNKALALLGIEEASAPPPVTLPVQTPPSSEDGAAIGQALRDLDKEP